MKKIIIPSYKAMVKKHKKLLNNIKEKIDILEKLLEETNNHWCYEDSVYRYYHNSFKVYYLQKLTMEIVKTLKLLSPHKNKNDINKDFVEIFNEGTGKTWQHSHNSNWSKYCRPILEAFFHAKYFLEMTYWRFASYGVLTPVDRTATLA